VRTGISDTHAEAIILDQTLYINHPQGLKGNRYFIGPMLRFPKYAGYEGKIKGCLSYGMKTPCQRQLFRTIAAEKTGFRPACLFLRPIFVPGAK